MTLRCLLITSTALALGLQPLEAQERLPAPKPVCGSFEYVTVDGQVTGRQITRDCVRDTQATGAEFRVGAAGGGAAAAGVLLALLALAASGGGGDADSPAPVPPPPPRRPRPPDLASPTNPADPASWRGPEFNRQYGLGRIGVEHRYAEGATGQGTLGAIYDSGIDLYHYDVGGIRADLSHSYTGAPGDLSDPDGHGTFVYGIAGARRNGEGIHGVAPDAQFMILKTATSNAFGDALDRAIIAGADAMNNSWGWVPVEDDTDPNGGRSFLTSDFASTEDLIDYLGEDLVQRLRETGPAGLSVIFATGNDFATDAAVLAGLPHFLPELKDNWIAATALGDPRSRPARLADYANRCGLAMDWCLAAPGTRILSLAAVGTEYAGPDELAMEQGTSFAAPHVFGAVLVLKSRFPELTTADVHRVLFDTAVDLGPPGTDPVYGQGALNLNEALNPQGMLMVEMGTRIDQNAVPLAASWIAESPVTGGALARALSGSTALVTDRYDRGYVARLGQRVAPAPGGMLSGAQARLGAAMRSAPQTVDVRPARSVDLRFDAYGPDHDITRVAHADPVMALAGGAAGPGFSVHAPLGDHTLVMANRPGSAASALSLGTFHRIGRDHRVGVTAGRLDERGRFLGATGHGAFGTLRSHTVYGRVQADLSLGARTMLNGSVTAARTRFAGDGLLRRGAADSLGVALGLTWRDAVRFGDRLSLALARPFSVSGGEVTLQAGQGVSAAVAGQRTNTVRRAETRAPLEDAGRAPELHVGYTHSFEARGLGHAALHLGAIAGFDGDAPVAARLGLSFSF